LTPINFGQGAIRRADFGWQAANGMGLRTGASTRLNISDFRALRMGVNGRWQTLVARMVLTGLGLCKGFDWCGRPSAPFSDRGSRLPADFGPRLETCLRIGACPFSRVEDQPHMSGLVWLVHLSARGCADEIAEPTRRSLEVAAA